MSGFDNEVLYSTGQRLEPSNAQAIQLMQNTADDVSVINHSGDPEGAVSANPASLCHDRTTGNLYYKQTGTGNTGWVQVTPNGVQTITGDTGGALSPTSGNFNILGQGTPNTSGIQVDGAGSTLSPRMASPYSLSGFSFTGGDVDVTRSNASSDVLSTVSNTSNAATSRAILRAITGGTASGDPMTQYVVTGGSTWSTGIDNSLSDSFTISASAQLGTTDTISIATNGRVLIPTGNLEVRRADSGATVTSLTANTSNTASSNALHQVRVEGTSAGDPFTTYSVLGTTNWSTGIDNSDSDAYVIAASAALGTTNVCKMTTAGEVTMPLQPAFFAWGAGGTDVTGNGTVFTVGTGTPWGEIYDQNGDFNTNGTFTAPVTGRYFFTAIISCGGLTASHTTGSVTLAASNRSINGDNYSAAAIRDGSNQATFNITTFMDMDAADTAVVQIVIGNGALEVDMNSGFAGNLSFSGYLAC